jgi:hypothetical protein
MAMQVTNCEAATTFARLADNYCNLVDSLAAHKPAEFLAKMQVELPSVYAAGAQLPIVDPGVARDADASVQSRADAWKGLFARLSEFLGSYVLYWEIFDPAKPEGDERVAVSLADDLADIYLDLKKGLDLWQTCSEPQQRYAVYEWRLGWEHHWGAHAVDALRAIHWHLESHWLGADEAMKPTPRVG